MSILESPPARTGRPPEESWASPIYLRVLLRLPERTLGPSWGKLRPAVTMSTLEHTPSARWGGASPEESWASQNSEYL